MKILYIAERYSSSSMKSGFLSVKGYIVETFYINSENADVIYNDLVEKLTEMGDCLVVGTSLGGFWANIMSRVFDLPSVLINPCYDPLVMINGNLDPNTLLMSVPIDQSYSKYQFADFWQSRYLILADHDELFLKYWQHLTTIWNGGLRRTHGNHQYSTWENLNTILECVQDIEKHTPWLN